MRSAQGCGLDPSPANGRRYCLMQRHALQLQLQLLGEELCEGGPHCDAVMAGLKMRRSHVPHQGFARTAVVTRLPIISWDLIDCDPMVAAKCLCSSGLRRRPGTESFPLRTDPGQVVKAEHSLPYPGLPSLTSNCDIWRASSLALGLIP